ncbi:hypothetical protein KM043_008391 [Ampulex compressa]|nr:hypothetical protein KM043_008391 [Ampulex compressa]
MDMILGRGLQITSVLGIGSTFIRQLPQSARCICCIDRTSLKLTLADRHPRYTTASRNYVLFSNHLFNYQRPHARCFPKYDVGSCSFCDSKQSPKEDIAGPPTGKKVSIFQRMKQMTKDYWHILIPVHIITSVGWVTIFYIVAANGVDIVKLLELMNLSEQYLGMLRNSSAGTWAVTYALYKIFTPLRYTITVGGTTMAIRYLNRLGYLKASSFRRSRPETTQSNQCAVNSTPKTNRGESEPPKT